jgi:hypothetical protein
MSSFEIISMIQQMLIVLVSFEQLIIALLSFRTEKVSNKKCLSCMPTG